MAAVRRIAVLDVGRTHTRLAVLEAANGAVLSVDTWSSAASLAGPYPHLEVERTEVDTSIELETKIKLNVGFPSKALTDSQLPVDGVGLARLEFILTSEVGVHPLLVDVPQLVEALPRHGVEPGG